MGNWADLDNLCSRDRLLCNFPVAVDLAKAEIELPFSTLECWKERHLNAGDVEPLEWERLSLVCSKVAGEMKER